MPPHSRFYAAVDSARMECPKCGQLLVWGKVGAGKPDSRFWNPVTSVIQCSRCLTPYAIGIVAWPQEQHGGQSHGQPIDQQLTVRQAAELRQRTAGFWAMGRRPKDAEGGTPINRYVPLGCCCDPLPWKAECPVHGGAAKS